MNYFNKILLIIFIALMEKCISIIVFCLILYINKNELKELHIYNRKDFLLYMLVPFWFSFLAPKLAWEEIVETYKGIEDVDSDNKNNTDKT